MTNVDWLRLIIFVSLFIIYHEDIITPHEDKYISCINTGTVISLHLCVSALDRGVACSLQVIQHTIKYKRLPVKKMSISQHEHNR